MIKSSLLKTRLHLLQYYDRELTASCVTQNGSFQSPCPLWEQEFRSSTDIRQLSTVNRFFCLMQWCDRELTAFGMSHRTAPPEPLFSVETGVQPLSVTRQPCLCVSLDCSQQLIQNWIRAWSFLNELMLQHQFLKTLCVFKWYKCFNRQWINVYGFFLIYITIRTKRIACRIHTSWENGPYAW